MVPQTLREVFEAAERYKTGPVHVLKDGYRAVPLPFAMLEFPPLDSEKAIVMTGFSGGGPCQVMAPALWRAVSSCLAQRRSYCFEQTNTKVALASYWIPKNGLVCLVECDPCNRLFFIEDREPNTAFAILSTLEGKTPLAMLIDHLLDLPVPADFQQWLGRVAAAIPFAATESTP